MVLLTVIVYFMFEQELTTLDKITFTERRIRKTLKYGFYRYAVRLYVSEVISRLSQSKIEHFGYSCFHGDTLPNIVFYPYTRPH